MQPLAILTIFSIPVLSPISIEVRVAGLYDRLIEVVRTRSGQILDGFALLVAELVVARVVYGFIRGRAHSPNR